MALGKTGSAFYLLILFHFILFFWPRHVACGILDPQPGIKPEPSAVKVWSPTTGPPGNSLVSDF